MVTGIEVAAAVAAVVGAGCAALEGLQKVASSGGVDLTLEKQGDALVKKDVYLPATDPNGKQVLLKCEAITTNDGRKTIEGHFMFSQRTQNLGRLLIPCTRLAGRVYFKAYAKKIALLADEASWTSFKTALTAVPTGGNAPTPLPQKWNDFDTGAVDQRTTLAGDQNAVQLWALTDPVIRFGEGAAMDRDKNKILLNSQNPYQAFGDERVAVKMLLEYDQDNLEFKMKADFKFPRSIRGIFAYPILSRTEHAFTVGLTGATEPNLDMTGHGEHVGFDDLAVT